MKEIAVRKMLHTKLPESISETGAASGRLNIKLSVPYEYHT
jgi:hypothetical protein